MRHGAIICAIALCFLAALANPAPALAHSGDLLESTWTDEPPMIDGTLSEAEWNGETITMPVQTYLRKLDATLSLTAMNDDEYLYLSMQVYPPRDLALEASNYELVAFYIDSNHDGVLSRNSDLVLSLYSARDYWSSHGNTRYEFGPFGGQNAKGIVHEFGWTGNGWVYEARIPFTLDSGYTWAAAGYSIGFSADWVTYRTDSQNLEFHGVEEIISPSESIAPFDSSTVILWDLDKTAYPGKFMDIVLAGSDSARQTTVTGGDIVEPAEVSTQVAENSDNPTTVTENVADTNVGPYIMAGIAVAGGAVAAAIALGRRRPKAG